MLGDSFAKCEVDPAGVVDEQAQGSRSRASRGRQARSRCRGRTAAPECSAHWGRSCLGCFGWRRKKSGPGPLLNTHIGTEKLAASIARSATRPACFCPQAVDLAQDRLGDRLLGVDRHLGLVLPAAIRVTALRSLSKPISGLETSLRTIRSAPLRSSLPRARSTASPPCSAAKPTIVCPRAALGGERGEDVLGRLQRELQRAGAPQLPLGGRRRRGSRRARRPSAARGWPGTPPRRRRRAGRRSRRRCGGRRPGTAGRRWRRSGSPPPRASAAAAARAMPIRPLERLPMKRTGSIGSRVPPAVTSTRRPSQGRSPAGRAASTLASSSSGSGRRPRPNSPREASLPSSGSITSTPALAQGLEVGLGGGVGVHAVVHRRGDAAAARCRRGRRWSASSRRRRPPAWRSCWPRPARPGRRRSDRRARGGRSGRGRPASSPGKAPRSGSRSNSEMRTGAPTMPSKEAAPTKRVARLGHQHPHAVAGQRRQPGQLEGLVSGDPAADA